MTTTPEPMRATIFAAEVGQPTVTVKDHGYRATLAIGQLVLSGDLAQFSELADRIHEEVSKVMAWQTARLDFADTGAVEA